MSGGPIFPISAYPNDSSGRIFPNLYSGGGGNASAVDEGLGVMASLSADATWELRFPMPPSIPTGTLKLRLLALANASSGVAKWTTSDKNVAAGSSPSGATLTSETQQSITWSAVDVYNENKQALSSSPSGNDMLVVAIKFQTSGWTLAQISTWVPTIIWE